MGGNLSLVAEFPDREVKSHRQTAYLSRKFSAQCSFAPTLAQLKTAGYNPRRSKPDTAFSPFLPQTMLTVFSNGIN